MQLLSKILLIKIRSSRPEVFCKKGVLGNFAKFTGKHLCQSLFFNKVAGQRTPKNTFLTERLSATASERSSYFVRGFQPHLFKAPTPWPSLPSSCSNQTNLSWFKQISKGRIYQFNCRFLSKINFNILNPFTNRLP